jgi:hypothetical protein
LFRLDSAASKLMGSYGQMVAGSYVKDLLKNMIVKKVPKLLGKSGPDDVSLSDIWKIIDSMLQTLVSKVSSAPFQLRVLCYYIKVSACYFVLVSQFLSIQEEVVKRFPGKGNIGIGAFVFLRLICPAIVAPEVRG